MNKDVLEILYTERQIQNRVLQLGDMLQIEYADKNPVFICMLKGSLVFYADLIRACNFPLEMQFLRASSYKNRTTTSGVVAVSEQEELNVTGRHVLIVEDIVDSGITLTRIVDMLTEHNPLSIELCTCFDKAECRKVDLHADYVGFTCPSEFLVGYGLDFAEKYRNLPYVGILDPRIYS